MPRIPRDVIDSQRRRGYVTVAEASRISGVNERTIRTWTRHEPATVNVRKLGPLLVFVELASLLAVAGEDPCQQTDAEILADLAAAPKANGAHRAPPSKPVREITLHRDEDGR